MALDIHQFPCLNDNYGFLIRDRATGACASIDSPDAERILAEAARLGWRLTTVLNTHWHADHAGGNAALKATTGCELVGPEEVRRIAPLDRVVGDGDVVALGETRFEVLGTPGHTLGHIAYYDAADGVAFVGDTLFALGCGRLFEGDAPTMWRSLSRLAALPDETRVYCAHEYTADNARFALSLDRDPALTERVAQVFAARERGEPTVPTTIGLERRTNPFLRASDAESFAAARAAKDVFR
jgi:hydroxyacylglutathione hydrolase